MMAVRKTADELVVITRTYDFILWSCNHVSKFPRNHRFVLGERNLYDLLETLIEETGSRSSPGEPTASAVWVTAQDVSSAGYLPLRHSAPTRRVGRRVSNPHG